MTSHVDPDQSIGFALKRLQQTLRSRMDTALAEYGLTAPQYAVLAMLAEYPGMSNAELARRNFVAAPTMLRILHALSHAGFIDRAEPSPEQRARGNVLTGLGKRRLAAAAASVQELESLLLAQAEPDHVRIMGWLRTCAEKLGDASC
ncbi:MarR family winged helix-turn-helix transcriptional regulator [Nocardia arthritidis]|uniref:MarR family transcriptional regulator n=1 Tax=Nocardia arthritidis TaxID=228602 RepID=A0A6G9YGH9_9NOCA|nr:MarR family transcriptional regulator [Nocardia arthritidis]QIS12167.1 MarR family transcriptional regulator [Nocardia arthritidis]